MVAAKPEVVVTCVVLYQEMWSQKLIPGFQGFLRQTLSNTDRIFYIGDWKALLPTYSDIDKWFVMSQIQYGGRQTGSTYISGSTLDSSEIPKVTPMFP